MSQYQKRREKSSNSTCINFY